MSLLDYTSVSVGDICGEALFEAGVVGQGMTPLGGDLVRAWSRLQFVLQQWERRRWMIYGLQAWTIPSNGAQSYTVGQGGDFNFGDVDFSPDMNADFGSNLPINRPSRLEGVFFRQLQGAAGAPLNDVPVAVTGTGDFNLDAGQDYSAGGTTLVPPGPGPAYIDYPLQLIEAPEDYWTRVRLKALLAWPQFAFYSADWPLGTLYLYPAVAVGYQVGIVARQLLPVRNATQASLLSLPPEMYFALLLTTAVHLRGAYQLAPDPVLLARQAEAVRVLRKTNTRVPRAMPGREWQGRGGRYNIFSDQTS